MRGFSVMKQNTEQLKKIKEVKKELNELGSDGNYGEFEEFLIGVINWALRIWNDEKMPSELKDDCLNEATMKFEEDFAELFVAMADKLGYSSTKTTPSHDEIKREAVEEIISTLPVLSVSPASEFDSPEEYWESNGEHKYRAKVIKFLTQSKEGGE